MTIVTSVSADQLVREILSAADMRQFVIDRAGLLDTGVAARMKSMVDHLVTVDFNLASRLAEAVWELGRLLGDDLSQAYAEAALGRVEYCHGHYSQALVHYQHALALMERAQNPLEAAILRKQQVGALMYLGKHREAIETAAQARRVLKRAHEREQLAELETNIGNLYCYLLDQYRKSLRYYERARLIFTELGNEVSVARVEYNLANALTNLDRIDEALCLYERAAATYRKHDMSVYAGQAEYNIAYLLFRRGQYNDALKCYYDVRDKQQELGDEVSVAWCNMDMAELYLQLSVYEECAKLATVARKSFLEFENTFKAAWAQTLGGLALAALGQLEEARRELSAALEEFSRQNNRVMVGLVHTYLADLELKAGNYQTALANAQEAERIFARERLSVKAAMARLVLAKLAYLTDDIARARKLLRSLQQRAIRQEIIWLEYECHYLQGCLDEAAGDYGSALEHFARAVDTVGRVRSHLRADELKSAFLRDKLDLFARAAEISIDRFNDGARALYYIEQAKSRSLADLLAPFIERELAGHLAQPATRTRFYALLNELNWYASVAQPSREEEGRRFYGAAYLKERRQRCEAELAEIFRRIQIEHASYAQLQRPASIDLPHLQRLLAPDETVIEYFSTGGKLSAFVITSESVRAQRYLIDEREAEELLETLQFQMEKFILDPDYIKRYIMRLETSVRSPLGSLYKSLIAPLADQLRGRRLTIIPHGLLHYVPFHALYDGERYLIEHNEISYAPSLAVYMNCLLKQSSSSGPILLFGLADNLAPAIAREIDALSSIFAQVRVLKGADATLANLKAQVEGCRIIHIASHGVVRPDNPLFSYLKMADGELTFYNTFDLKLCAELVTLSACHTGINRIFPGDELHGLMRGFLYAGTPSLLVSLWQADDLATSELMSAFYRRLTAGQGRRAALRGAQMEIINKSAHPYYWAPFVLMGKP